MSYVCFKWFSGWMPFLSDPLLLELASLSFYSLMLIVPQPPNLFVFVFMAHSSVFVRLVSESDVL